jgi:hypothetical protein
MLKPLTSFFLFFLAKSRMRCRQRAGKSGFAADICAFDDCFAIGLRTSRSTLARRERVDAKAAQRVADFIHRRRALL